MFNFVQHWYYKRAMIHDFTTIKHSTHFAMYNKHFVRRAPEEDSCSSPSSVSREPDLFRKGVQHAALSQLFPLNQDHQRMMVYPMLMIVQSLRSFLTAVTTTAVAPIAKIWPEFTWIYLNLLEFTWIYRILPVFTWIYLNFPNFSWIYLMTPEFTWIYLNIPEFV